MAYDAEERNEADEHFVVQTPKGRGPAGFFNSLLGPPSYAAISTLRLRPLSTLSLRVFFAAYIPSSAHRSNALASRASSG